MDRIGIIGGSGLYNVEGLELSDSIVLDTPFGNPSSEIAKIESGSRELYFIARHGVKHSLLPSEVNYAANIYALKTLGVDYCIGIGAVGSLREEYKPGDIVIPNQFIDRTKNRRSTFFGSGIVAHAQFASPFCNELRKVVLDISRQESANVVHDGGTYLCMEGPQFSTRAESKMYRDMGADIIGMTNLTEAKLAREAEISYSSICFITDYDCWRSENDDVDIAEILAVLSKNKQKASKIIKQLSSSDVHLKPNEAISKGLDISIITQKEDWPESTIEKLKPILKRYCENH